MLSKKIVFCTPILNSVNYLGRMLLPPRSSTESGTRKDFFLFTGTIKREKKGFSLFLFRIIRLALPIMWISGTGPEKRESLLLGLLSPI